jgi:hypothetical protein
VEGIKKMNETSDKNEPIDHKQENRAAELSNLLGPKHTQMRVSAPGLLGRIRDGRKVERGHRYMVGQMLIHLEEIGKRYYVGDIKAVDEFLQLYCLDAERPK